MICSCPVPVHVQRAGQVWPIWTAWTVLGLGAEESFLNFHDGRFADGFQLGDVADGLPLAQAAGDAWILGEEFGRGETGTLGASEFAAGSFVAGAAGVQAFLDVLALDACDLGEERDQDGGDVVGGAVFLKGLDSHVLDVEGDAAGVQVFDGLEDLGGVAAQAGEFGDQEHVRVLLAAEGETAHELGTFFILLGSGDVLLEGLPELEVVPPGEGGKGLRSRSASAVPTPKGGNG